MALEEQANYFTGAGNLCKIVIQLHENIIGLFNLLNSSTGMLKILVEVDEVCN